MGKIYQGLDVETQHRRLEENFNRYKHEKGTFIFKALARTYKSEFMAAFFINFLVVWWNISIPILISLIVKFMQSESDDGIEVGIAYIAVFIFASSASRILEEQAVFYQDLLGDKAFSSMISLIYNKTLKLSPATNKEFSQGEIINFIQVDSEKLCEVAFWFPPIARLPIQLIFSVVFLLYHFGYYLLVPVGVATFMIIFNYFIAKWLARLEAYSLERKDKRMNIITEVMSNIKIIKLNSWIKYFIDKITIQRNKELYFVKKRLYVHWSEIFVNFMMSPWLILIL